MKEQQQQYINSYLASVCRPTSAKVKVSGEYHYHYLILVAAVTS